MRHSSNFDFEKLRRKISPYCKTTSCGNFHTIKLKYSSRSISFTYDVGNDFISTRNISTRPHLYTFQIHFTSQKDLLRKLFVKHELFDNE